MNEYHAIAGMFLSSAVLLKLSSTRDQRIISVLAFCLSLTTLGMALYNDFG